MKLAVLSGPMKGETLPLTRIVTIVGRSPEADIMLPADTSISRLHCKLVAAGDGYLVEDLGSSNGTLVAGRRIREPTPLPPRVRLLVGDTRLCLLEDHETTLASLEKVPEISDDAEVMPVAGSLDPMQLLGGDTAPATHEEVQRLQSELDLLHRVGEALVGKLEIEDVLETVGRFLLTIVPAGRAVGLRPTGPGGRFSPVVEVLSPDGTEGGRLLSGTLIDRVVRDKVALLVGDTMEDGELRKRGSIRFGMIRSAICAPLIHRGEVKAVIQLDSKAAYSLSDENLRTVTAAANHAALAVANSELYDELRAAHARLGRGERLATVGTLSQSIAHDIGNALTPIAALSVILARSPDVRPDIRDAFDRAVRRLTTLTRQLLALGRPEAAALTLAPVDVNAGLRSAAQFLATEAERQGARIQTDLAPGLPSIVADPDRLDQVFVNLSLNALQAMAGRGGRLLLHTRLEADRVVVEITDTGPGIPPENLGRIFEPFFSTKGDKGTGLGLHICRRIVEQDHGGSLEVRSKLGEGTTFSVRLPLTTSAPRA